MPRLTAKAYLATALVPFLAGPLAAQDYGSFEGETLRVKLIGGAQYEPLYAEIDKWEEMTGATVEILSRKNHFELDREIKQDIAAGTLDWCVGSNHTSFAPQYGNIYVDLREHIDEEVLSQFVQRVLGHSTVGGRLVQLPRHSDISNLYYIKSLYEDAENQKAFEAEYGYPLAPPETWDQVSDQARFFADPPDFYGTQYVGKDEAITGRFYEMLVAEGGQLFDDEWMPVFNSEAGVRALRLVRRSVRVAGRSAGCAQLPLGRYRGWLRLGHGGDQPRLGGLVGVFQRPRQQRRRRRRRPGPGAQGVGRGAHRLVGLAQLLDHRDLRQQGRGGLVRHVPDRSRPADDRGAHRLLPTRTQVWDDAKAEFEAEAAISWSRCSTPTRPRWPRTPSPRR